MNLLTAFVALLSLIGSVGPTPIPSNELVDRLLVDASGPSSSTDWISLAPDLSFLRINNDAKFDVTTDQILTRNLKSSDSNSDNCAFLDSNEEYPEYAVAWRMLGLSMDCDYAGNRRRRLEGGDDQGCTRVLLYAVVGCNKEFVFSNRVSFLDSTRQLKHI